MPKEVDEQGLTIRYRLPVWRAAGGPKAPADALAKILTSRKVERPVHGRSHEELPETGEQAYTSPRSTQQVPESEASVETRGQEEQASVEQPLRSGLAVRTPTWEKGIRSIERLMLPQRPSSQSEVNTYEGPSGLEQTKF